jgi:hypothetical protein
MPNQKYCQKPPNSRTVVKTAATYESTPAKVAQENFTIISQSTPHSERALLRLGSGSSVLLAEFRAPERRRVLENAHREIKKY